MPTIAIVGASPGLGLSIARLFGGHGFDIARTYWDLYTGRDRAEPHYMA